MKRFLYILNRFKEDRADLTQVLIIVAGFAVAAVIAIMGITQVTQEKVVGQRNVLIILALLRQKAS